MATDPFALLGLPRSFDLTRSQIEEAYLTRIGGVHPDVLEAGADGQVDQLNLARQTLADPESRANLLLDLLGGPGKGADRSLPDGFLIEMMEAREQMESAAAAKDRPATDRWAAWAESERNTHMQAAVELFAHAQSGAADALTLSTLKALRTRLNAWRYIERMLEQLDAH